MTHFVFQDDWVGIKLNEPGRKKFEFRLAAVDRTYANNYMALYYMPLFRSSVMLHGPLNAFTEEWAFLTCDNLLILQNPVSSFQFQCL